MGNRWKVIASSYFSRNPTFVEDKYHAKSENTINYSTQIIETILHLFFNMDIGD